MNSDAVNPAEVHTWLYAVVPGPSDELPEPLTGVAGEPVRLVTGARVAAFAGSVPRADFDEAALNAHIQDPVWLERAVREHHRVISTLGRVGRMLPMRFATLCQDDARAVALLGERQDRLLAAIAHVSARTEWGVKAWAVPKPAEAEETPGSDDGSPGAGTAYLARLRSRRAGRDRAERRAIEEANLVHARLAAIAADWVEHQPQPAAATGRDEPMLVNRAYLVDESRSETFREVFAEVMGDSADLDLQLTGPWPPYSFADLDRPVAPEGTPP